MSRLKVLFAQDPPTLDDQTALSPEHSALSAAEQNQCEAEYQVRLAQTITLITSLHLTPKLALLEHDIPGLRELVNSNISKLQSLLHVSNVRFSKAERDSFAVVTNAKAILDQALPSGGEMASFLRRLAAAALTTERVDGLRRKIATQNEHMESYSGDISHLEEKLALFSEDSKASDRSAPSHERQKLLLELEHARDRAQANAVSLTEKQQKLGRQERYFSELLASYQPNTPCVSLNAPVDDGRILETVSSLLEETVFSAPFPVAPPIQKVPTFPHKKRANQGRWLLTTSASFAVLTCLYGGFVHLSHQNRATAELLAHPFLARFLTADHMRRIRNTWTRSQLVDALELSLAELDPKRFPSEIKESIADKINLRLDTRSGPAGVLNIVDHGGATRSLEDRFGQGIRLGIQFTPLAADSPIRGYKTFDSPLSIDLRTLCAGGETTLLVSIPFSYGVEFEISTLIPARFERELTRSGRCPASRL